MKTTAIDEMNKRAETLHAVHDQKMAARVAHQADLDAAKQKLAAAESAMLTADDKAIESAIAACVSGRERIKVHEARVARAEDERIAAANAHSEAAKAVAIEQAAATGAELDKNLFDAERGIASAAAGLVEAISRRDVAVEAAAIHNKVASAYSAGVVAVVSTREILHQLGQSSAWPFRIEFKA